MLFMAACTPPQISADDKSAAVDSNNCAPTGELRGDAERGAAIHDENCAECHGYDGKAEVIVMHMDDSRTG